LLDIIAKNVQQKSPAFEINGREVVQPFVWYTCPAGKIARVKGTINCTSLGAAAQARFSAAGVIKYRWARTLAGGLATLAESHSPLLIQINNTHFPPPNTELEFDVTLSAGQTIETSQSSGSNSEFNVFAEVVESPV